MEQHSVKVRVPGTTANCGPGFDAVGIACTLYNTLEVTLTNDNIVTVDVAGAGKGTIPIDDRNIAFQAIQMVFSRIGANFTGIRLSMDNAIPLARGLGSSAAAIVAGLIAANHLTGNRLAKDKLVEMATELEGHPDNVTPAILGGITISVMEDKRVRSLRIIPPAPLSMVVTVPEFTLSTKLARQALPQTVPFKDAVYNVSRTGMLIAALCKGEFSYLDSALNDRLHQPYRQQLIPGMESVFAAARNSGAIGAAISGAGPSLIAFTTGQAIQIGEAMTEAFKKLDINSQYYCLQIDSDGAKII